MNVGVVLPAALPSARPELRLEWARRADGGPFSTLGIIDRLVYPGYDPLISLAAAAAITARIRLMPTILIAPLYSTGILLKQLLSLDALSGGRLALGLGVGVRQDDFEAAPAAYNNRGHRFEQQLCQLRRSWDGEQAVADGKLAGPRARMSGRLEVLIGGYAPVAIRRVGRHADGFIAGSGLDAPTAAGLYAVACDAWADAGRPGRPRFAGVGYFALGAAAVAAAGDYLRHYYAFLGPVAHSIASSVPCSPAAVTELIESSAAVGMDEFILAPCSASLDELDRLSAIVSGLA